MKTLNVALYFLITLQAFSANASTIGSVTNFNQEWNQAINKAERNDMSELYTDNAIIVPANSPVLDSRSIGEYLNRMNYVDFQEFIIWDVEVNSDGNTAYQTALWETVQLDENGNESRFDINITNVLEKQSDGSWKIKFQSWN